MIQQGTNKQKTTRAKTTNKQKTTRAKTEQSYPDSTRTAFIKRNGMWIFSTYLSPYCLSSMS